MITRAQLVDVEDRQKLIRLAIAAACALAIAFIWLRLAEGYSPVGEPQHQAPAAANHAAGAFIREVAP